MEMCVNVCNGLSMSFYQSHSFLKSMTGVLAVQLGVSHVRGMGERKVLIIGRNGGDSRETRRADCLDSILL
jgi:hypothetical protein